jgi:hypothetical protein
MPRRDSEPPMRARVAADVERKDTILFGFTFRQVVILTVAGLLIYTVWTALATVVPPLVFIIGAVPVAGSAFVLAAGRRDGIPLDRWLLHALRHRRAPHRLVPARGPASPAPAWVQTTGSRDERIVPAPLRLPARGVTGDGLIDLGPDGTTALVAASTVPFGLRTPGEQNSLVAGFGRWLNSLDAPVQILVRAQRVDLTAVADRLHDQAPSLPHPQLETAALAHVAFLDDLAAGRELLHRRVTIAVRDRRGARHAQHRAAGTVRALAGCDVTAKILDGSETAAAVAASLDPTGPVHPAGMAPPTAVIHGTGGRYQ